MKLRVIYGSVTIVAISLPRFPSSTTTTKHSKQFFKFFKMEDGLNAGDFLARFSVAFSWDYPDDYSLNDVLCSIFYIIDDKDAR